MASQNPQGQNQPKDVVKLTSRLPSMAVLYKYTGDAPHKIVKNVAAMEKTDLLASANSLLNDAQMYDQKKKKKKTPN